MPDYHTPRKPNDKVLEHIKRCYVYTGSTGELFSLISSQLVGYMNGPYLTIKIQGVRYRIHHIAWFLYYNRWPERMIDHKDQDKLNNKIDNLREATTKEQYENKPKRSTKLTYTNKSKYGKGIYKRKGRYEVYVVRNKIRHYLGVFNSIEDANKAIEVFNEPS